MGVQKKARGGGGIRPCKTHEDFWSEMQLLNLTSRSAAAAGVRTFMMVNSSDIRLLSATEADLIRTTSTVLIGASFSLRSLRTDGMVLELETAEFRYQSGLESSLLEFDVGPFLITMDTVDSGLSVPISALWTVSAVTSMSSTRSIVSPLSICSALKAGPPRTISSITSPFNKMPTVDLGCDGSCHESSSSTDSTKQSFCNVSVSSEHIASVASQVRTSAREI
jgi:hypothetical protein